MIDFSTFTREELEAYANFEHGQNVQHLLELEQEREAHAKTKAELIALLEQDAEDANA